MVTLLRDGMIDSIVNISRFTTKGWVVLANARSHPSARSEMRFFALVGFRRLAGAETALAQLAHDEPELAERFKRAEMRPDAWNV
jgi:hypothetical protein